MLINGLYDIQIDIYAPHEIKHLKTCQVMYNQDMITIVPIK